VIVDEVKIRENEFEVKRRKPQESGSELIPSLLSRMSISRSRPINSDLTIQLNEQNLLLLGSSLVGLVVNLDGSSRRIRRHSPVGSRNPSGRRTRARAKG